jgi:hypothetical protein
MCNVECRHGFRQTSIKQNSSGLSFYSTTTSTTLNSKDFKHFKTKKQVEDIINMQLTTIVALLAASASAAPGTLSPRASGSVRARFYNDNGCDGNGAGVPRAEVVLQTSATPGKAGCRDLTVGSFPAAFYDQSTLDQQSRSKSIYSLFTTFF